jgi:hypothetical protein
MKSSLKEKVLAELTVSSYGAMGNKPVGIEGHYLINHGN